MSLLEEVIHRVKEDVKALLIVLGPEQVQELLTEITGESNGPQ